MTGPRTAKRSPQESHITAQQSVLAAREQCAVEGYQCDACWCVVWLAVAPRCNNKQAAGRQGRSKPVLTQQRDSTQGSAWCDSDLGVRPRRPPSPAHASRGQAQTRRPF